jgi:outer membrane lipoprotein SlyB
MSFSRRIASGTNRNSHRNILDEIAESPENLAKLTGGLVGGYVQGATGAKIGTIVGAALGGPVGAIVGGGIGFAIGHTSGSIAGTINPVKTISKASIDSLKDNFEDD